MRYWRFKLRIAANVFLERSLRALETAIIPALLLCSLALLCGVACKSFVWLDLAHRINEPAKDRIEAENEIMRTVAQVLGGSFVLAGLYFTGKNIFAERRSQMSDRFATALESLSHDNQLRRLGGIHALESLAHESPKEYPRVVEFLAQFVREETMREGYEQGKRPRADIQQALYVLGRRGRAYRLGERQRLDLRESNLLGADLREANLEGALLNGADLRAAVLQKAFLRGADFSLARLDEVNLNQADLRDVNFWKASLDRAELRRARLENTSFAGGSLREASFERTTLKSVVFQRVKLDGALLTGAQMSNCVFEACSLSGTELDGAAIVNPVALTRDQLAQARTDHLTRLPDKLRPDAESNPGA